MRQPIESPTGSGAENISTSMSFLEGNPNEHFLAPRLIEGDEALSTIDSDHNPFLFEDFSCTHSKMQSL